MMRLLPALLAALFPQRTVCHACGAPLTASESLLCPACAASLRACAVPPARMETVVDVYIAAAAAPFAYQGAAAALAKALKYSGDRTAALPLAEGMAAAFAAVDALRDAQVVVPVPVHYRRLRRRGYNQAAVLAAAFCEATGTRLAQDALVRVHHKHSQVGMSHAVRRANIAGAFAVSTAGLRAVRGKTVLLVDDVLTTGSTAAECADVLMQGGAVAVMLLTACRA